MKILHVHLDPPGNHYGTGNFYRKITESLNKRNIFGTNICCNRYKADTFYESNIIFATKRVKRRFPLITYLHELIALEIKSFFYLLKNNKKYDLIISYNDCGILTYFLSKFYKKKYLKFFFHLHKTYVDLFYKEKNLYEEKLEIKSTKKKIADFLIVLENYLRIFVENFFLIRVNFFFTCLQSTKKEILKYRKKIYKKSDIKVLNILYEKKINTKNKYKRKKNILMLASDLYHKGFVRFLEIISINNFELTKIYNITIIGLTNLEIAKKYIVFFGLDQKIKIYGFVGNKINKFYQESDLFVNLSLIEGWNMAITDAYLSKKIIVSSKVGCINEIFSDNKNVFPINRKNNKEFFKILMQINQKNTKFKIDKKYEFIKKSLTPKLIIDDYIAFFESILRK